MKHFLKIKHIKIFANGETAIILRNNEVIMKDGNKFVSYHTGAVLEPLYDEFGEELVGFIDA